MIVELNKQQIQIILDGLKGYVDTRIIFAQMEFVNPEVLPRIIGEVEEIKQILTRE